MLLFTGYLILGTPELKGNRRYLEIIKGNWNYVEKIKNESPPEDIWLAFCTSFHFGDWQRTRELAKLAFEYTSDWGPLWLIRSAKRKIEEGNFALARSALDYISEIGSTNSKVWSELGLVYEAGGLAKQQSNGFASNLFDGTLAYEKNEWFCRAEKAYKSCIKVDANQPWAEGTYYLAFLYYHQARWKRVVQILAPMLINANDEQIMQPLSGKNIGEKEWQNLFILLGQSYQQLGEWDLAATTWRRIIAIRKVKQDWTLNLSLRSIAAIETKQDDYLRALDHWAAALELALGFPDDYRLVYEQATWDGILNFVRFALDHDVLYIVKSYAIKLTERSPNSASIWFILGLLEEADCRRAQARIAYNQAIRRMPIGAGSFVNSLLVELNWKRD